MGRHTLHLAMVDTTGMWYQARCECVGGYIAIARMAYEVALLDIRHHLERFGPQVRVSELVK